MSTQVLSVEKDSPTEENQDFQTQAVATIAGAHTANDTFQAFLPPLLPVLIENLALSKTQAGLLSVFLNLPSALQPYFGQVADRVNLRPVVILAPAVTAVMMSLIGIANQYALIGILLFIAGLSSAVFHSVAPVIAGKLSGAKLGRGMSFWMVGGEAGRAIGPLVLVGALNQFGIINLPWLMLGGFGASTLLYYRLKNVPMNTIPAHPPMPVGKALHLMGPMLISMAGLIFTRGLLIAGTATYLPTYMTESGASLWFAGLSLSIMQTAGVVGAMLGGTFSDKVGRRVLLVAACLTTPIFMVLFLTTPLNVKPIFLALLGFTSLSMPAVMLAIMQENFPENRALANGMTLLLFFITSAISTMIVGMIGDRWGLTTAFYISAGSMLLGAPLVFLLPAHARASQETQP